MGFYTKFLYLLNFLIPLLLLILITTLDENDDEQYTRLTEPQSPKRKLFRSKMTEEEKKADEAAKRKAINKLIKSHSAISFGSDMSDYKTVLLSKNGGFIHLPTPPTVPVSIANADHQPTDAMLMCPGPGHQDWVFDSSSYESADFSTGHFDDCLELQAKASVTVLYDIDSSKKTNNDPNHKYLVELARFNGNIFADKNKVLKIDFAGPDLNFYLVSLAHHDRKRRSPRGKNAVIFRSLMSDAAHDYNEPIIKQEGYQDLTGGHGPIEHVGVTLKVEKGVARKMSAEQVRHLIEDSNSFVSKEPINPIEKEEVIDNTVQQEGSAEELGSAEEMV